MRQLLLLFVVLCSSGFANGQDEKVSQDIFKQAKMYYDQKRYDSALIYYQEVTERIDDGNLSDQYVRGIIAQANCLYYQQNYNGIISLLKVVVEEKKDLLLMHKDILGEFYMYLGIAYAEKSDYINAYKMNKQALDLLENTKGEDYAVLLNNLGEICKMRGDFKQAINYLLESISLEKKLKKSTRSLYLNYINLGGGVFV